MKTSHIHILLEKYFEGETSIQEENILRDYFLSEEVSDDLKSYKILFTAFAQEKNISIVDKTIDLSTYQKNSTPINRFYYWGIAATVLVLITSWVFFQNQNTTFQAPSQQELIIAQKYLKQGFETFDRAYNQSNHLIGKTDIMDQKTRDIEKMAFIYQKNINSINHLKYIDQSFEKLQNISSMQKSKLKLVM